MSIKEWVRQIVIWREQYGVTTAYPRHFDPTRVSPYCFICGKVSKRMSRHHTGNDMLFARMLPDHFAANYVRFRREDVERLCHYHHKRAHAIYKVLVTELYDELNTKGQAIITPAWCESWRQKFREKFYKWATTCKARQGNGGRSKKSGARNRRRKKVRHNRFQSRRADKE